MTHKASARRHYLALFFPYLAAERWQMETAKRPDAPLVFTHKVKSALRIAAACPEALALGLSVGLALADARARVPGVRAVDHDPAGDAYLIEGVADWCDRYTPMVALDPPDGLMLDITGCGDALMLAADAATRLQAKGLSLRHALAETPDMARALARFLKAPPLQGRGWGGACQMALNPTNFAQAGSPHPHPSPEEEGLERLPITALELPDDSTTALHRAGLASIADLAARPRSILAARFGEAMTAKLARVLGEEDVRITPRRVPPALFVTRRFAEPVARTDFVLEALAGLVAEAAIELDRRGQGGRAFAALLYRSDGAVHMLEIATGRPTRDPALVLRLLRERIDALADPLDPGFGYDAIRLDVPVAEALGPAQLQLEGGERGDSDSGALIDRLGVRLGTQRVRRFASGDSHIPEQAAFTFPASAPPLPLPFASPEPGEPPLRPLHLFDPPYRIEVMAEVPDGPPRRFRWRRTVHDITRYEGPERIAAEWWKRRSMKGLTRDYYRVEDARGRRFWVFRHGLYGAEKANPDWYLHGVFA